MDAEQIGRLIDVLHREKKIEKEILYVAIEKAIELALRKSVGAKAEIQVSVDRETCEVEALADGELLSPEELGRIPAQNAKQVLFQKIREAEGDVVFEEFSGREGEMVSGTVQRFESGSVVVSLTTSAEGYIQRRDQIPGEHFRIGDRTRCIITEVKKRGQKVQILVSRAHPDIVRRLFELEIPEVNERLIVIKDLVREPGERTKIAVASYDPKVDCVGACVGVRGSRIKGIIDEFNGEKIDIIRWNESPEVYITNALKPAQISRITLYPDQNRAVAVVPEDQLSLAIGRKGQNVRLAAKLSTWSIDIMSEAKEREQELRQKAEFMQIPDVGEALAERFITFGCETLNDIKEAGLEHLVQIDGLSEERAKEILAWVENLDPESLTESTETTFQELWGKYGLDTSEDDQLGARLRAEFAREEVREEGVAMDLAAQEDAEPESEASESAAEGNKAAAPAVEENTAAQDDQASGADAPTASPDDKSAEEPSTGEGDKSAEEPSAGEGEESAEEPSAEEPSTGEGQESAGTETETETEAEGETTSGDAGIAEAAESPAPPVADESP